jgi:hypothetical protein
MHKPIIRFLVSSPDGDIQADRGKWHLPLERDPAKISYRQYFHAIEDFLSFDNFSSLLKSINQIVAQHTSRAAIKEIIIRSEKHGTLYHPASIEVLLHDGNIKFGLNVATTDVGKQWLKQEFSVLRLLHEKYNLPYLPNAYLLEEKNHLVFVLEDWFEGYHEFHLSQTTDGKQILQIWDFGRGYKNLTPEQAYEIYRQSSLIMTSYYDVSDYSQIYPWHHGGGDFIASVGKDNVSVRLTTARRYDPGIIFQDTANVNASVALTYFLLNLTLKMRLDRLDGVGEVVWADDSSVLPTLQGFFEGLQSKEACKKLGYDILNVLQSFSPDEMKQTFSPLIDMYEGTEDHPVIIKYLDRHIDVLTATLQNFPQRYHPETSGGL